MRSCTNTDIGKVNGAESPPHSPQEPLPKTTAMRGTRHGWPKEHASFGRRAVASRMPRSLAGNLARVGGIYLANGKHPYESDSIPGSPRNNVATRHNCGRRRTVPRQNTDRSLSDHVLGSFITGAHIPEDDSAFKVESNQSSTFEAPTQPGNTALRLIE